MRVNEATQNAAAMWTLGETIESFPVRPSPIHSLLLRAETPYSSVHPQIAMHNVNRHFIDCIDVEEILPNSSSGLRCTLFLFNDKLLIAKRPTGAKGGRQHAGLDDIDTLVELHATVDLTTSQNTSLGSPKKLKKGVMGYRGHVDLNDVYGVDLEAVEFGLVFDTPIVGQGDRWSGRERRRFEVSETYASDVRKAEKEAFLRHFEESKCRWRAKIAGQKGEDLGQARKSEQVWEDSADGACTTVYWTVWGKEQWEKAQGRKVRPGCLIRWIRTDAIQRDRPHLRSSFRRQDHLHRTSPSQSNPIRPSSPWRRSSILKIVGTYHVLHLLFPFCCSHRYTRFSVYTRDRPNPHVDMIPYNRIVKAISEIGTSPLPSSPSPLTRLLRICIPTLRLRPTLPSSFPHTYRLSPLSISLSFLPRHSRLTPRRLRFQLSQTLSLYQIPHVLFVARSIHERLNVRDDFEQDALTCQF
jgi:hypothetical protein